MINDLLERIFLGSDMATSRSDAKGRLKLVLAHDRANLTSEMMTAMRRDILEVVSKYVELDPEGLDVSLESDQRSTALIANLPIRRIKASPRSQSPGATPTAEAPLSASRSSSFAAASPAPTPQDSPAEFPARPEPMPPTDQTPQSPPPTQL